MISLLKSVADFAGVLSSIKMAARTTLSMKSCAILNFQWRAKVRVDTSVESMVGINFIRIPFMVMDKIGIKHMDDGDSKEKKIKIIRNN